MTDATAATNSGVAPFNMPVTLDDTCCSAYGNIVSGYAIHTTPSRAIFGQSLRGMDRRDAGKRASTPKPTATRMGVISAAGKASSPSAMK